MTGVKWHSSAPTLAAKKSGTNNVVKVIRAMIVGGGVSLRNTGSSPTADGDIYIWGVLASQSERGWLRQYSPQRQRGYLAKNSLPTRST